MAHLLPSHRSLAKDGEAAKAGVQVGDRIMAIMNSKGELLTDHANSKAAIEKVITSDPGAISMTIVRKERPERSQGDAFVVSSGFTPEKRPSGGSNRSMSERSTSSSRGAARLAPSAAVVDIGGPVSEDIRGMETSYETPSLPSLGDTDEPTPTSARDKSTRKLSEGEDDETKMAKQAPAAADEQAEEPAEEGLFGWFSKLTKRDEPPAEDVLQRV